jgi:hypothetical protein
LIGFERVVRCGEKNANSLGPTDHQRLGKLVGAIADQAGGRCDALTHIGADPDQTSQP